MLPKISSLAFVILVFAACGRDKHDLVVPDCPPPPTCECAAIKAELDALKAKANPPASVEDEEHNCTAEYAAQKNKSAFETYSKMKAGYEEEVKKVKDQVAKTEDEASQLPEPSVLLGTAPMVTDKLIGTLELVPHFDIDQKKCRVDWTEKPQQPIVHNDWRYAVAKDLAAWQERVGCCLRNKPEGFETDMNAALFFVGGHDVLLSGGNSDERRDSADKLISLLANGGPAVQWAVGIVMRLQPEDAAFTGRQLKRLYTATKVNFVKLDKEVRAATEKVKAEHPDYNDYMVESSLPPEHDFGPEAANADGYYKGLVFRYWRYKEVIEKGSGKAAVAKLQQVLRGVASGMKVNLQ